MQFQLNGVAPLTHSGLIRAQGDDAAKFLHNQLTNDFVLLGAGEARLAGFCSAKGRLQASFIGVKRSPGDVLLLCSADILPTVLKRLSMFVLRAKAKLSDASAGFQRCGLAGAALQALSPAAAAATPWTRTEIGAATLVTLYPADGCPRALWIAEAGSPPPAGPTLTPEQWAWSEVRAGIATVTPPIAEAFVPQMLNYESVGGVNFKKGCYPGQEVVARSQFRGTLKRRAYLAHGDAALQAGDELFDASGESCGTVAQAAANPDGGFDAIVSLQISAFEVGTVYLGQADGPRLALAAPPYPLLADI